MLSDCFSLQYINLFNYIGKDIFDEISNNKLSICINDFNQINSGNNSLKNNNVTIDCKNDSQLNDKTPKKRKKKKWGDDWKTVKILKIFKALKRYKILNRLKKLIH